MHTLVHYLLFYEQQRGWAYSLKFHATKIIRSWYETKLNLPKTLLVQICPINTSLKSTVGTVTSLWDGQPMNHHSLLLSFQKVLQPTPPPVQWVSKALSPRAEQPFHETGHSAPSSAAQGQIYFTFMQGYQDLLNSLEIKHKQLYGFQIIHCLHPPCK